jgi:hypothetical protein
LATSPQAAEPYREAANFGSDWISRALVGCIAHIAPLWAEALLASIDQSDQSEDVAMIERSVQPR